MFTEDVLILRNEILLTVSALFVLCAELLLPKEKRAGILTMAIACLAFSTLIGFLPGPNGILFGGMYQTSQLISLMKNILNVATLIVLLQSMDWLRAEHNVQTSSEFVMLLFSTLIGMSFMVSSGHFLMFYLGLELATIPLAALAAFEKYKRSSSEAGIKFILLAALSSGFTLFGLSLIYGTCGSMLYADVSSSFIGNPLQILAFIFFISGLAFKISLVPFHLWTADVYEGAPITISSYLSVVSKGAAVFILLILLLTVFHSIVSLWSDIMTVLAVLTMTVGNLFALRQQKLKRFLAFSSIAQAGFLLLGMAMATQLGSASVVYFIVVYVFSNLAAFGTVAVIQHASGKESIDDYNGLYKTNPLLSLTLMLALFSLAGIPPAAGFFGKLFLFASVAQKGQITLLVIATLNATISLYYYLLVVKAMFINKSDAAIPTFRSSTPSRIALGLCVSGIFIVGFASGIFDSIFSLSRGF